MLSKADAIVIALGTDEDPYSKSTCFQVCDHNIYHISCKHIHILTSLRIITDAIEIKNKEV